MIRWFRTARFGRGDEGVALVMVLGMSSVLILLVGAAVTYAVNSQQQARASQDFNAAMAAAYAGVEEYQSRLANDTGYFQYGNPAAPFTVASGSASGVILPVVPVAANPAFGVGETGSWATVAGSGGDAEFRYEVDNSKFYTDGTLRLRSTGRAGGETRSIVADLRQKGFIEFLYFTDYEIQDPLVSGAPMSCVLHRYAGRSTSCQNINFISADTINGPLHSNDGIQICGSPQFLGITTSSYAPASGNRWYPNTSCSNSPAFPLNPTNNPTYLPVLGIPETNNQLRKETERGNIEVPNPGCMFTGPTKITFNADGTMRVKSPWTKFTSSNATQNNDDCGTPGTSGLGAVNGQVIPVKNNNVVFVQNVPTVSSDPNYWAPAAAGTPTCLARDLGTSSGRNADGNPVGYPVADEYVNSASVYGCKNGDAFIEGTVDGRMTLATENYLYVTGNVQYEDMEDDMLGLIGQNAVMVSKPERQNSSLEDRQTNRTLSQRNTLAANGYGCVPTSATRYTCERYTFSASDNDLVTNSGRRIDAAILSVAHTFQVQNYNRGGNRGTLTINGAISQKFRGTVGTGSGGSVTTGYAKNYQYDARFRYTGPPKYLSPVTTTYGVNVWVEVSPAFDVQGRTR